MIVKLRSAIVFVVLLGLIVGCKSSTESDLTEAVKEGDVTNENFKEMEPNEKNAGRGNTLAILAWNVESGGADPKVIAERLKRIGDYDVFCLSEVHPDDFATYQEAVGPGFESVTSKTGSEDRLQIIYNRDRFELLEKMELDRHGDYVLNNGGHRSPTAVRLLDRLSGKSFIVMVNHLARGNAEFRKAQAIGLREWARDQDAAIINVGDFNMDYEFATGKGNEALDEILRDNVWKWVQPKMWIDSNWWDPDGDGVDNFDGSLLDFAFVAGPAKTWGAECEVMVELGDFPDDETTSDHRPISLLLELAP